MEGEITGVDNIISSLYTLEDVCTQLHGDPAAAVRAIRRSGVLVPIVMDVHPGRVLSYEEREAKAARGIEKLQELQGKQDALRDAMRILQGLLRDISKAQSVLDQIGRKKA